MKKIISLFSVVAAMLLISALPAFSAGTGPYGAFGPTIDDFSHGAVDNEHVVLFGGTGPYGGFGPSAGYSFIPGVGEKAHAENSWGTGPYGVFNSYGMIARDKANKNECLLVAVVCPLRGMSR